MKLNLLGILCLSGVSFVLPVPDSTQTRPFFISQSVTWPLAQNYCRKNHIDLFTLTDATAQTELINRLNKKSLYNTFIWLGLFSDLDSWYWTYQHLSLKNTSLSKWLAGYPDSSYGSDACAVIRENGVWRNYPCDFLIGFICYDANKPPANRFVGYPDAFTWYDAQLYCQTYHTDLATALTQADNDLLQSIVIDIYWTAAWFGLTKDTWKWSDGSSPTYLPWYTAQPDNSNLYENCGASYFGYLTDEPCTITHFFACSAYLHRTQILKLQVITDQNVLDPAWQSSVLELFKLKLQENGMAVNTTATWKVQLDGSIFYKKVNIAN